MKYILTIFSILLSAPLTSLQAVEAPKVGAKPNIVFLFADDMGWGDLHCYGQGGMNDVVGNLVPTRVQRGFPPTKWRDYLLQWLDSISAATRKTPNP